MAGAVRAGFVALLLTLLPRNAASQAVLLQAGSSSLFDAHGATIEARRSAFTASLSAGQLQDRFTVGALLKRQTRNLAVRLGDDVIDFRLPTDVFGGARYVPVRGAAVELMRSRTRIMAMAGGTSTTTGAPFFHGATWGSRVGLFFADHALAERWHLFSRNAFSSRQTTINGLDWRLTDELTVAAAGGLATGKSYLATSAVLERTAVSASVEYVRPHGAFSRVLADSPMAADSENENLSLTVHPHSWWSLSGARQHFVNALASGVSERATVNRIGGSVNAAGFRLNATVFDSPDGPFANRGTSFSVARHATRSVDIAVDHFRSVSKGGDVSNSLVTSIHEAINPRLSVLQVISTTGHQPSFSLGGEILTNPVTISVSYQTVYAPFRPGSPFVQTIGIDVHLQPAGGLQLHLGTYTSPSGRLRYTISCNEWFSSAHHGASSGAHVFRLAKYLVRGQVIDVEGVPIDGAAVRVGREDLLTDREGRFFVRTDKTTRVDLAVLTEAFATPGQFTVVSAPTSAMPASDERAPEIVIIISRR